MPPLVPTEGDMRMIQAVATHGVLTSEYLACFRNPNRPVIRNARERLRILSARTNTAHKGTYLLRPGQQRQTEFPLNKHLMYDLTPTGERLVEECGTWNKHARQERNPWLHYQMLAAVSASIHIECMKRGYTYVSQAELLGRVDSALGQTVKFKHKRTKYEKLLKPDRMFGIDYGGKFRLFFLEVDRGTEPEITDNMHRKSIYRSLLQYQEFIRSRQYKDAYDVHSQAMVLFVFGNRTRQLNCMELLKTISKGNSYICFKTLEHFGMEYFVPPPLFPQVFEPWERAERAPLDISTI